MLAEWLTGSVFNGTTALPVLAAATGGIALILRQPLIVSLIAVWIIAGPSALDIVHSNEPIDLLAELGVAILLFLVGIKPDVELIRTLGPISRVADTDAAGSRLRIPSRYAVARLCLVYRVTRSPPDPAFVMGRREAVGLRGSLRAVVGDTPSVRRAAS